MPQSLYLEISRAAGYISSAFEKLTLAALADDALLDLVLLTEKERRWARLETGYSTVSVNSRLDTFLSDEGFRFLEFNAENPAGIGDQISLEELFRPIPGVRGFLSRHRHYFPKPHEALIRALDSTYREFGGRRQTPSIAIVDWAEVATRSEFYILQEYFESNGYPTRICDPEELEFDGKVLRHHDFEIDIFFKRVIIHEFLERYDETHPLFAAIEKGAVCMANSFRSKIPHKKSSFAMLSDHRFHKLFTRHELDAIERHIPWTRRVEAATIDYAGAEVDLIDLVRTKRDRFVLKPNDEYGGKGIFVGWECDQSVWDGAIESALLGEYVVQERVPVKQTEIPACFDAEAVRESLLVDFDPFLFCGRVEGGLVRLSSRSLVNITQGGGETALAILNDY
jgi:hypothetical protein